MTPPSSLTSLQGGGVVGPEYPWSVGIGALSRIGRLIFKAEAL